MRNQVESLGGMFDWEAWRSITRRRGTWHSRAWWAGLAEGGEMDSPRRHGGHGEDKKGCHRWTPMGTDELNGVLIGVDRWHRWLILFSSGRDRGSSGAGGGFPGRDEGLVGPDRRSPGREGGSPGTGRRSPGRGGGSPGKNGSVQFRIGPCRGLVEAEGASIRQWTRMDANSRWHDCGAGVPPAGCGATLARRRKPPGPPGRSFARARPLLTVPAGSGQCRRGAPGGFRGSGGRCFAGVSCLHGETLPEQAVGRTDRRVAVTLRRDARAVGASYELLRPGVDIVNVGTPVRFSAWCHHGRIAMRWFSSGGVGGDVTGVDGRVVLGFGSYRMFHLPAGSPTRFKCHTGSWHCSPAWRPPGGSFVGESNGCDPCPSSAPPAATTSAPRPTAARSAGRFPGGRTPRRGGRRDEAKRFGLCGRCRCAARTGCAGGDPSLPQPTAVPEKAAARPPAAGGW